MNTRLSPKQEERGSRKESENKLREWENPGKYGLPARGGVFRKGCGYEE